MTRPLGPFARTLAALIALTAFAALAAQWLDLTGRAGLAPLAALWDMAFYLTILTSTATGVTFAALAFGTRPSARGQGALLLSVLLVALGYHLLLAGLRPHEGLGVWADLGFHSLLPGLVTIWWLIFAPKPLRLADLPAMLLWPAFYASYALTRGGLEARFPYPFLDPLSIGWPEVLRNMAEFALGLVVLSLVLIFVSRVLPRR